MNRGRMAQLWGGPEDGAAVWMAPGDLPARVGVHRTARGELVPVRGRALVLELDHLPVYEHAGATVVRDLTGNLDGDLDRPWYVWAPLVTRWAGRPPP